MYHIPEEQEIDLEKKIKLIQEESEILEMKMRSEYTTKSVAKPSVLTFPSFSTHSKHSATTTTTTSSTTTTATTMVNPSASTNLPINVTFSAPISAGYLTPRASDTTIKPKFTPQLVNSCTVKMKDNNLITSNLYEVLGELTEKVKQIAKDTEQLSDIKCSVTVLRTEVNERFAGLSARVLSNEEELHKLKQALHNKTEGHKQLKTKVSNLEAKVNDTKEKVDEAQDKTMPYEYDDSKLSTQTNNLQTKQDELLSRIGVLEGKEDTLDKFRRDIQVIRDQVSSLQTWKNSKVSTTTTTDAPNTKSTPAETKKRKEPSYKERSVKTDNVILIDSNGKGIDPSRMHKSESCERFTCYTLEHVQQFLNEVTITKQPKRLLLHVGTNDVDHGSADEIADKFGRTLTLIREKMPETRILVSRILRRKRSDHPLKETIQSLNDKLVTICDNHSRTLSFSNDNVNKFYDDKHVDSDGFRVLVGNFKFVLFGIMPAMPRRQKRRGR